MEVSNGIFSVGAVDSELRMLHGYETPMGTSYNAYLVLDEQITLVDLVKEPFSQQLLENIRALIGARPIDRIICNHAEPDHSGALPALVAAYPNAVVYGTASCKKELLAYYPSCAPQFEVVKLGDSLCTGAKTFQFIPMPMVHWPDSMSSYLVEDRLLFSNDALGQHIGTAALLDTDLGEALLIERAADYYANIVLPFGTQVAKLLDQLEKLDISMVCPSHGVVLQALLPVVLKKYRSWCGNETREDKAVIVYDTMWGTTHKMALKQQEELAAQGISATCFNLSQQHFSRVMGPLLEARHIYVGSPTLNNTMMPTVSAFLTYLRGLKPKNRIGRAFGSYGWSGESIGQVQESLAQLGFTMLDPVKVNWNL